jgi:hypothetical protein
MPRAITDVSETDHRNRFRVGKCGKYPRTFEIIARQSEKLRAFWSDPENRRRQSERWTDPEKRARQSDVTKTAIARQRSERTGGAHGGPTP